MQKALYRLFGALQTAWCAIMKTLITKCDATGDVVRTTPLLRVLQDEIWWVTASPNDSLLPRSVPNLRHILTIGDANRALDREQFDLVLSLDGDPAAAALATNAAAASRRHLYSGWPFDIYRFERDMVWNGAALQTRPSSS